MEFFKINKEEIREMLEELSFNILIQYINKDLAELERIKYTAKALRQGVITEQLAELLIARANEMYDVVQGEKRLYWYTYVEGYNNREKLRIPISSINGEVREILEKFYLTKEELSKLKELLENSNKDVEDKKIQQELEKNTIFPQNFNKRKIEIRIEGNTIKTISEYDTTLIDIVKKLGYRWNSSQKTWERNIDKFNGPLIDRLVELATKLLDKGYAVKVPEEYLESIKKGEYASERTRWVTWSSKKNMFLVWWEYNEKIKSAFKNIKSTCENYKYYVKVEFYQEILEFAEIFNFSISELAQENINQYKKEFEDKKIKVTVKKSSKTDKNLEDIINQGNEIIEDLKDN